MALSTQRKVYVGILVVAVGALAVDQLFLQGGPGTAPPAAPPAVAAGSSTPISVPATIPGKASRSLGELAERIEKLRSSVSPGDTGDAFILPAGWRPPEPVKLEAPAPKSAETVEAIRARVKVTSTVIGQAPIALINGEARELNESFDGLRLVAIYAGKVEVEVQATGAVVTITVDQGPAKTPARFGKSDENGVGQPEQIPVDKPVEKPSGGVGGA